MTTIARADYDKSVGARCQCELRVGHDLGLRFRGSERSAGSSLIDSQLRRTRDLAVIFTTYESASKRRCPYHLGGA
jgi:hypothetical protein